MQPRTKSDLQHGEVVCCTGWVARNVPFGASCRKAIIFSDAKDEVFITPTYGKARKKDNEMERKGRKSGLETEQKDLNHYSCLPKLS